MTFFQTSKSLTQLGNGIISATLEQFPALGENQLALTWIVYDSPPAINTGAALTPGEFWNYPLQGFAYRGIERIYPGSLVQLFYLVALYEWINKGMLQPTAELERATRDMIIHSSCDATSLIVDSLSGTTSGPELSSGPFETWKAQRNLINRYFKSLNWPEFASINVNQKIWCDGAYGRERAFLGELMEHRNMLTPNATARLLHSIIGGVAASSQASKTMMKLIQRSLKPEDWADKPKNFIIGFLGEGLPATARLWSKSGQDQQVRHEAAYIEIPDRPPYLLVVFTEGKAPSQIKALLPFISQKIAEATHTIC
ncbi:MAG: serine hydrolase [Microcoleaceae cyanobacterium]